jgi:hypothetical protein
MPREPKIVFVSDEEFAAQKAAKAKRCQRYEVIGDAKIRDAIDRDGHSRSKGEFVMLDPEETVIALLVGTRLVKPAPVEEQAPVKAKAGKDA